MRKYIVYVGTAEYVVSGYEVAYEVFRIACDFSKIIKLLVCLVDSETGEVLADNQGDE